MLKSNDKNDKYEDEIDRMRARRAARAGHPAGFARQDKNPDLRIIDPFDDEEETEKRAQKRKHSGSTLSGEVNKELHRHKSKKRRRGLCLLLTVVFLIGAGFLIYQHFTWSGRWTVAVYGLDSRDGNLGKGTLSDVEMLCSINRRSGEIRIISVFRDTYLKVSDNRYDKINEAYFLGGHEQASEALEANLDIQVEDYAAFNWKAAADAINQLGGVDLEITDSEFSYINSFITETVESTGVASVHLEHSGQNHLDGVQAVAYARLRLMDTDFNRTERQRKVLGLVMDKLRQADAGTLTSLVKTILPQISTSIGMDDLLKMAANPKKYYIGETSGFPFSHEEINVGKKSCVIPTTLESNVIQLHAFLYEDESYTVSQTVKKISADIAAETGLSEPGRDMESGKNVGAGDNSGTGNQSAEIDAETSPEMTVVPTMEPETATDTAVQEETETNKPEAETDSVKQTEMMKESGDADDTASPTVNGSSESHDGRVAASSGNPVETIPEMPAETVSGAGTDGPPYEHSDENGPGTAPGSGFAPGNMEQTPEASLEAPGQQAEESSVGTGPGVTN